MSDLLLHQSIKAVKPIKPLTGSCEKSDKQQPFVSTVEMMKPLRDVLTIASHECRYPIRNADGSRLRWGMCGRQKLRLDADRLSPYCAIHYDKCHAKKHP